MQEMFNEDLKKLKNKQSTMNNAITEIKNTLERTNNWVTEAEKWINELEDRMVEIIEAKQNEEQEWKEMRIILETSGTTLSTPTF